MQNYTTLVLDSVDEFFDRLTTFDIYDDFKDIEQTRSFLISLKNFKYIKYKYDSNQELVKMNIERYTSIKDSEEEVTTEHKQFNLILSSSLFKDRPKSFDQIGLLKKYKDYFSKFGVYSKTYVLYIVSRNPFKDSFFEDTLLKIAYAFNLYKFLDNSLIKEDVSTPLIKTFEQNFYSIELKVQGIPVRNIPIKDIENISPAGESTFNEYVLLIEALPVRPPIKRDNIIQSENWISNITENTIKKMSF